MARIVIAAFALGISLLTAGAAGATNFDFAFSAARTDPSGGTSSATGTLTATAQSDGTYLVSDITGSYNGETITGIVAPDAYFGNDNLLFPGSSIKLDVDGVSFSVEGPGDLGEGLVNIWYSGETDSRPASGYSDEADDTALNGIFTITQVTAVSAAPEPSTWMLMLGSVGAMGLMLRRRRRAGAIYAA